MGHPPHAVWGYTLRQLTGYVRLAGKRVKREKADALALNTLAARGEEKAVKKTMRELSK